MNRVTAPLSGTVIECNVNTGEFVAQGQILLVLESMKVHVKIEAEMAGELSNFNLKVGDSVKRGDLICEILPSDAPQEQLTKLNPSKGKGGGLQRSDQRLSAAEKLHGLASDSAREDAVTKRHAAGFLTARENLNLYCNENEFVEYGRLAVAAQSRRYSESELRAKTAADGVITGLGNVAYTDLGPSVETCFIVNDYSVLAGTQGFYHHAKIDRMLDVALARKAPVIMYTEGGGGRPGDTDVQHVNSGLACNSFSNWAGLSGVVPRISVANGYNFAGNAALFGAADIRIATKRSYVGMAGPAMIAGGGLGEYKPTEIGPIDVQSANGVVDLVADDEQHAAALARQVMSHLLNQEASIQSNQVDALDEFMPSNRKLTYNVRDLLGFLVDNNSLLELRAYYGGAIGTFFARVDGKSLAIIASDCMVNGGAIDVNAGRKASEFIRLCNNWKIPLLILSDTPGFMVGPDHESLGAVRELADLFAAGARCAVPSLGLVVRKCYGLGAQALLLGSTKKPDAVIAWPTGEFGAMGLEGAVQLGFKKELEACESDTQRQELFDSLVAEQYRRGAATQVATVLEIDAVVAPRETRHWIRRILFDLH